MQPQKYNMYFLVTGIVLVAVIAGLVVLGVLTSLNIKTNNDKVSTLQSQQNILQTDLAAAQSQISSMNTDLTSAKSQISSLGDEVDAANSQISALKTGATSTTSSISTLQNQLSTISSQLTTLQSTVSSFQNTITSLQSTVTSLSTRVSSLESAASSPQTLFSSLAVSQAFGTQTILITFTPTYSGTLYISGTSSSSAAYIRVLNNTLSTHIDYAFGTGTTVTSIVSAGYSYSIIFYNTASSGTITATLTGIYYPSASSSSTTLFSSQAISQAHGAQTTLITFTPTHSGTLYVSGTSNSSLTYIRIVNNTLGTYTDYAFGTSATVSATVSTAYNYSIIFHNTAPSGTVTATLTAIYYY